MERIDLIWGNFGDIVMAFENGYLCRIGVWIWGVLIISRWPWDAEKGASE